MMLAPAAKLVDVKCGVWNQNSVALTVGWKEGFDSPQGQEMCPFPQSPGRFWDPPSLLLKYCDIFPRYYTTTIE
jgi:hypothetical protein